MARNRRSLFVLLLIVLCFSILGGIYGSQVHAAATAPEQQDARSVGADLSAFAKAYSLVERNFATEVSSDKAIYDGAIPGMLRMLDPHSSFFDPRAYKLLQDDQVGHYFGVGMTVSPRDDKTVVLAPFPGSPAYKAGIRPGDIIEFVNDKPVTNLNTTEVADLLKGPRGTPVKISLSREGAKDYLTFTIIRDEISRKSVPDAFWVKPGIAYIKILSFGDNTSRELDENLKRLDQKEIHGLVLDLRSNPGGVLNEGVDVAGAFLQKGQAVVSAHGRASPERVYTARFGNHGYSYPIVVLVNQYSASAAEIVAGALQDHDRAWILGETTFGKGLVQTVFPMRGGTGLALTTAHFYTPSGRLIQRDYSHESFFDYYYHKDGITSNPNDVKMTDSGRTVYGGGGITPDEKYDTPVLDTLQSALFRNGLFAFTRWYFSQHSSTLPQGWMPDANLMDELHDYLLDNKYAFTETQFTSDYNWIKRYLAKEMYIYAFNVDESDKLFAKTDPEVSRAVAAMPEAAALVANAKKVMAERTGLRPQAVKR